ncbi:MAG: hypothetical protein KGI08_03245 [Thaumarchaeota archaeon]|nr:hypothetical protein [Nitrososphaerota archaeon]
MLNKNFSPEEYSQRIRDNIGFFALHELGIDLTPKQLLWVTNSTKKINLLTPGNQWGKTLVEAVKHIWHANTKHLLEGRVASPEEWLKAEYETLNFGLTYEIAKPVKDYITKICEGELLIYEPDGSSHFNESKLKGWAIVDNKDNPLPTITWFNGAKTLFRSYDNMGSSFKAKRLAFISGDEVGDIPELRTFVTGTLLPRLVAMDGKLDLVGTPQADKSEEYQRMVTDAQDDKDDLYYYLSGSMYDNLYLPKAAIQMTENIADPELRRQIIYGEFVSTGEKYFTWDEIRNAIDMQLTLQDRARNGQYICSVDFSAAEDYTVIVVLDYSREPYKLVYHMRFKGKKVAVPMQYELVKDVVKRFNARLIIDSSALGGKNALSFLATCNPIGFNFTPKSKAEMLASFKIALQGGTSDKYKRDLSEENGIMVDKNPDWGLIRFPDIPELIKELQNYRLDDESIKNDQVMALGMAVHWIEIRKPRNKRSSLDIDLLSPKYWP